MLLQQALLTQVMDSNTETFTRAMQGLEAPPKPPVHPNGGWQADQSQLVSPSSKHTAEQQPQSDRLMRCSLVLKTVKVVQNLLQVQPLHLLQKTVFFEGCCLQDSEG